MEYKEKLKGLAEIPEITNGRIERLTVFRDFFELLAIRISNGVDPVHLAQRHEFALKTSEKYTEAELDEFERYFSDLLDIYAYNLKSGNLDDVLGRLYEKHGHLSREQELTPDGISIVISRILMNIEKIIEQKGFLTLGDSTCGSGGIPLKVAEEMLLKGYNLTNNLVVLANDINSRSVHMAYIQLSMYGIPAVVTQADILSLSEDTRWYTPIYILGNWVWRSPVGHTTARNRDDELLKMMTHPIYTAIRRIEGWPPKFPDDDQ